MTGTAARASGILIVSGLPDLFLIVTVPSVESLAITLTSISPDSMPSNSPITLPVGFSIDLLEGLAASTARGTAAMSAAQTNPREKEIFIRKPPPSSVIRAFALLARDEGLAQPIVSV